MEILTKALSSSVQIRIKRHDHKPVQELLKLLFAADSQDVVDKSSPSALQLHSMLWDTVVEQMAHPMNSVFQQAIISFLIHRPQHAEIIIHATLSCLQHGPVAAAVSGRQAYHKRLPLISGMLACFRGLLSEPGQEGMEHAVGRSALASLCVTMLQCMAKMFQQQQQLAIEQKPAAAVVKAGPPTCRLPVHIHPNSLVRLFVDCLLEVHDSHERRQLLVQALSASQHSSPGMTSEDPHPHDTDEPCTLRPTKRQRVEEVSNSCCLDANNLNEGYTSFGLLLAQACHDDLLRHGHPTLAADVIWLSISHPTLFSDADSAAASQMLLKALPSQTACQSSPAAGLDMDALVRHAAWCHWSAHHENNWKAKHSGTASSADAFVRLLILLNNSGTSSRSFPKPGSFINAPTEVVFLKPSKLHAFNISSNTQPHPPVIELDVGTSKHETADTSSESEHQAMMQDDASSFLVPDEEDEQVQAVIAASCTSPNTITEQLPTGRIQEIAPHPQQGQRSKKQKQRQRQAPGGSDKEQQGLGGFLGFKAVQVVNPPLHPAWVAAALLPALVKVIADEGNGCGGYALASSAKGVLHSVLVHAHVLLLPEHSPAMVGQACRALAGWAKTAPSTAIETLASAWCSVWVSHRDAWRQLLDVTSLQGLVEELVPCSDDAQSRTPWTRAAALLCLCNHLPIRSPLYCTAMVAYLSLIRMQAQGTECALAMTDAILGQRSPATAPSFSYLDNCRVDMLRGALLVSAAAKELEQPQTCIASQLVASLQPTLHSICMGAEPKGLSSSAKKVLTKACSAQGAVVLLSDSVFATALLQLMPVLVHKVEDV